MRGALILLRVRLEVHYRGSKPTDWCWLALSQGSFTMRQIMFPGDASFRFETLRSFNNIEYGGAGFGEDVARSGNIADGDYDSWHDAYLAASDRSRRRRTTRCARATAGTGQGLTFMGLLATVSTAAPTLSAPMSSACFSPRPGSAWPCPPLASDSPRPRSGCSRQ